jgi:hypothetical protein
MVMFCAAWTLVDRRTTARYDRNMEFVVPVAVRCKRVVSLGLATLGLKFGFERCDLSSSGGRPVLDVAEPFCQRAWLIVTNGVRFCRTHVADVAMHSNPDDLPVPENRATQPLVLLTTSENRHNAGRSI